VSDKKENLDWGIATSIGRQACGEQASLKYHMAPKWQVAPKRAGCSMVQCQGNCTHTILIVRWTVSHIGRHGRRFGENGEKQVDCRRWTVGSRSRLAAVWPQQATPIRLAVLRSPRQPNWPFSCRVSSVNNASIMAKNDGAMQGELIGYIAAGTRAYSIGTAMSVRLCCAHWPVGILQRALQLTNHGVTRS